MSEPGRKQRRRSSFEESNRNKNGVLEWTDWNRPSSSRNLMGPEPIERDSFRGTIPQEWIADADVSESSWEEINGGTRIVYTKPKSWLSQNMYGLILAGVTMAMATSMKTMMEMQHTTGESS